MVEIDEEEKETFNDTLQMYEKEVYNGDITKLTAMKDFNENKNIIGLKYNPLFEDNPGFTPDKDKIVEDKARYYRQNHQILSSEDANDTETRAYKKNPLYDVAHQSKHHDKGRVLVKIDLAEKGATETYDYSARTLDSIQSNANSLDVPNGNIRTDSSAKEEQEDISVTVYRRKQNNNGFAYQNQKFNTKIFEQQQHWFRAEDDNNNDLQIQDLQRSNSSRSNPNVSFGSKLDIPIPNDDELDDRTTSSNIYNRVETVFSPKISPRKNKQGIDYRQTDLKHINFGKMSARLRRSTSQSSSSTLDSLDSSRREKSNVRTTQGDKCVSVDNSQQQTTANGFSDRSTTSKHNIEDHETNKTTVMLARGWSGKIISTYKSTTNIYDYGLNIYPVRGKKSGKDLNGLIFRSSRPITEVKPSDHKDILSSLRSLDRRLKVESEKTWAFKESMDWITQSQPMSPAVNLLSPQYYRESNCLKSELPALSKCILRTGWHEGQNMRVCFYNHLHKITTIVNTMLKSVSKQSFPFNIKPLSFQGEFERKGQYEIDLYLVLDGLDSKDFEIDFVLQKLLTAYICLPGKNKENFKRYCVQKPQTKAWVLSASNLMVMFSYIVNTHIKAEFDHNSNSKKRSIPFDAQIYFLKIVEGEAKFQIKFEDEDDTMLTYDVGLQLALSVPDFPNVLALHKKRRWPNAAVKTGLIQNGVHLLAKPNGTLQNHMWTVAFLKTRKVLLACIDNESAVTTVLLALQVIKKNILSKRGCEELLLPVHFIMILFWAHVKYQYEADWKPENLGKRFIDILIALKRCLLKKQCKDFFFPTINYFETFSETDRKNLLLNVGEVLENPMKYVKWLDNSNATSSHRE